MILPQTRLCFIAPQADSGNVITPAAWANIGVRDIVDIYCVVTATNKCP